MSRLRSFSGLKWVGSELDEVIRKAREALEEYVEGGGETAVLGPCVEQLSQVRGVLEMLQLRGAGRLAEEMQVSAQALKERRVATPREAAEALMLAMIQLPDYLEKLESGGEDIPLVLLPAINDLRASRGVQPLSEADLVVSGMAPALERKVADEQAIRNLRRIAHRVRPRLHKGLLGWFRGTAPEEGLKSLRDVFSELEENSAGDPVLRGVFRTAHAVTEGLLDQSIDTDNEVKGLVGRVDRIIKQLGAKGVQSAHKAIQQGVLKDLLHHVSRADSPHPTIQAVKADYDLDRAFPSQDELAGARQRMLAPNADALAGIRSAAVKELLPIKDTIDLYMRGGREHTAQLLGLEAPMLRLANTLGMVGLSDLSQRLRGRAGDIKSIASGAAPVDDALLMGIAGDLLYVESSLENVEREAQGAVEGASAAAADVPRGEMQSLVNRTLEEAAVEMAKAKDAIVTYMAFPADTRPFEATPAMFHGVAGALRVISQNEAADVLDQVRDFIQKVLITRGAVPEQRVLDSLAEAITGIEYYMEAVGEGRRDTDQILNVARAAFARLEQVPKVEAEVQLPEPEEVEPPPSEVSEVAAEIAPPSMGEAAERPAGAEEPAAKPVPSIEEIDPEILEIFLEEAREEEPVVRECFKRWCETPGDSEALVTLRRSFHTLKGSGRLVGAMVLGDFAWSVENLLNRVIDQTIDPSSDIPGFLDQAVAALPELINAQEEGRAAQVDTAALMARADALAGKRAAVAAAPGETVPEAGVEKVSEQPVVAEEPESGFVFEDSELAEIFEAEAREHLETLYAFLADCEQQPLPCGFNDELVRSLHTLAGSARMVGGLDPLAVVAKALEVKVGASTEQGLGADAEFLGYLKEGADAITAMVDALHEPSIEVPETDGLLARVEGYVPGKAPTVPATEEKEAPAPIETGEALFAAEDREEETIPLEEETIPLEKLGELLPSAEVLEEEEVSLEGLEESALVAEVPEEEEISLEGVEEVEPVAEAPEEEEISLEGVEEVEPVAEAPEEEEISLEGLEEVEPVAEAPEEEEISLEGLEESALVAEVPEEEEISLEGVEEVEPVAEVPEGEEISLEGLEDVEPVAEAPEGEEISLVGLEEAALVAEAPEGEEISLEGVDEVEPVVEVPEEEEIPLEGVEEVELVVEVPEEEEIPLEGVEEVELVAEAPEEEEISLEGLEEAALVAEAPEGEEISLEGLEEVEPVAEAPEEEEISLEGLEEAALVAEAPEAEEIPLEGVEEVEPVAEAPEEEEEEIFLEGVEEVEPVVEVPEEEEISLEGVEAVEPVAEAPEEEEIFLEGLEEAALVAEAPEEAEEEIPAVAAEALEEIGEAAQERVEEPVSTFEEISADPELTEIFLEEAEDLLENLDGGLREWQLAPDDSEIPGQLQRTLHTLKGGARLAGIQSVGKLSHVLETLIGGMGSGELGGDPQAQLSLAQRATDALSEQLDAVRHGQPVPMVEELIQVLQSAALPEAVEQEPLEIATAPLSAPREEETEQITVDRELLEIFLEEAQELLDQLDNGLRDWGNDPDDKETPVQLNRNLHTLKGGARMAGIQSIGDLSHALETLLSGVTPDMVKSHPMLMPLAQQALDRLSEQIDRVRDGRAVPQAGDLVAELESMHRELVGAGEPGESEPAAAEPAEEAAVPDRAEVETVVPLRKVVTPEVVPPAVTQPVQEQVRVRSDLLNHLVNNSGEISIYRARLEQQNTALGFNLGELEQTVARLHDQLRQMEIETEAHILYRFEQGHEEGVAPEEEFDPLELDRFSTIQQLSRSLIETVNDLVSIKNLLYEQQKESETLLLQHSRISNDLQDGLLRTRMVPFTQLVPRLRRVVRQTANALGKRAALEVFGGEGEMDRSILDRMLAPMEHILRNAVSHGIEPPERRRAAGKKETGKVSIYLAREGNDVIITVSDDGAGLNLEAIRRRAVEMGLLESGVHIKDDDLMQLVLEPGFSTVKEVTQISGRGVGTDVMVSEVKQLGGSLEIDSQPGQGTSFSIRLPFTLAISESLLVELGDDIFAVPHPTIEGVVRISAADLARSYDGSAAYFSYAGHDYKVRYLGGLLGTAAVSLPEGSKWLPLLLVRSGEHRVAIQVDHILGNRQVVVKSVGPQLSTVRWISGGTILPDGRVALILDVSALVRKDVVQTMQAEEEVVPGEGERPTRVMVVDDSITVRKVTTRLLKRHNMEVSTAKDGVDAVAQLQEERPDVMLLDIEMPRMDGYELARHMRNSAELRDIPIIMITSRSGEKHRNIALSLGVKRYLGKPYQESELLDNIYAVLAEVEVEVGA